MTTCRKRMTISRQESLQPKFKTNLTKSTQSSAVDKVVSLGTENFVSSSTVQPKNGKRTSSILSASSQLWHFSRANQQLSPALGCNEATAWTTDKYGKRKLDSSGNYTSKETQNKRRKINWWRTIWNVNEHNKSQVYRIWCVTGSMTCKLVTVNCSLGVKFLKSKFTNIYFNTCTAFSSGLILWQFQWSELI